MDAPSRQRRIAGNGTMEPLAWGLLTQRHLSCVPPYPGFEVVRPARVPEPPVLPPGAPDKVLAAALINAYIGAVKARYRQRVYTADPRRPERCKGYAALCDCATAMIGQEIAPVSWALWSIDVWRGHIAHDQKDPTAPPHLGWVWLASRVLDHHGWFHGQGGSKIGGQVQIGDAHKALVARWTAMREALLADRTGNVRGIVAQWFPDGSYGKMVADAQHEADRLQRFIDGEIAAGSFLWR